MISHPNVKVNLGLEILRKRTDGFHDLETLFVPYFGISDTLEIISGDDYSKTSASLFAKYGEDIVQGLSEDGKLMITIAMKGGADWDPLKDLCARAYRLMDEKYTLPPVKIFLEKISPVGAGLGGGSSDAAFTLKMLSEMFSIGLDAGTLAQLAATLGSDCAFFVYNSPMIGEGRGNVLSHFAIEGIDFGQGGEGCGYLLKVVVPDGIKVSTAEAYKGIVPREAADRTIIPLKEIIATPVEEWRDRLENDFETSVFAAHPELGKIKQSLYDSGAVYASMSGSGSALFAIYKK